MKAIYTGELQLFSLIMLALAGVCLLCCEPASVYAANTKKRKNWRKRRFFASLDTRSCTLKTEIRRATSIDGPDAPDPELMGTYRHPR